MPLPGEVDPRRTNLAQLALRFQSRFVGGLEALSSGPMMGERQNRVELANLMCVLEIGSLGSLLPEPLPQGLVVAIEGALPHLDEAPPWPATSLRTRLLRLFRRRISGETVQESAPDASDDGLVGGVFSEFLALNDTLRNDADVSAFIETLEMNEARWNDSVVRFLINEQAFRGAMQAVLEAGPGGSRDSSSAELRFGSALIGAGTYVNVMEAVKSALDLVAARPIFRSAMWHYHAPAFAPRQATERLDIWLTFARRQMRQAGLPEDDASAWAAEGEAAVTALRADDYGGPLAQFFRTRSMDTRDEPPEPFGQLTV